jgi:predicted DNA-binding protein YlxM (UPF0122 family)
VDELDRLFREGTPKCFERVRLTPADLLMEVLSPRQCVGVLLFYVHGMGYHHIAKTFGVEVSSVRQLLKRARRKLRGRDDVVRKLVDEMRCTYRYKSEVLDLPTE